MTCSGLTRWVSALMLTASLSACAESTGPGRSAQPTASVTPVAGLPTGEARAGPQGSTVIALDDLRSAPVPALCTHPAGKLVGGKLPGVPAHDGYVEIAVHKGDYTEAPVRVDLTGDGVEEIAAVIDCSAGGVAWPQVLVVYRTGLELLGHVDLGDVSRAEHSTITGLTPEGRGMRMTWTSTEGCCSNERRFTGLVVWDGRGVAVRDVAARYVPGEQCSVAEIEAAWKGESQHCLEPEILSHLWYPGSPFSTAMAEQYLQHVVFIQLKLRDLGYPMVIDGKFGPQTAAVVRRYQSDRGFVVDGEVGLQTWKGLFGLGEG